MAPLSPSFAREGEREKWMISSPSKEISSKGVGIFFFGDEKERKSAGRS